VDYRRYKYHKIFFKSNRCNPALAQNLAVNEADGDFIILTSPEVVHWKNNLKELDKIENLDKKFVYGRVIEKTENEVFGLKYPFDAINKLDSSLILCDWNTRVKSVTLYFIGVMSRDVFVRYGGIDEYYMTGIAYDDEDFGKRMDRAADISLEFNSKVVGIHLTHDRAYQEPSAIESNRVYLKSKEDDGIEKHLIANSKIKFADPDVLIERSHMWRF
jgi:hypothetical protein